MRRLLMDCPPCYGSMLALAIAAANENDFNLCALTTVYNAHASGTGAYDISALVKQLGLTAPVETGAHIPLPREGPIKSCAAAAVELLRRTLVESGEPVDILALGPLTNLAALLQAHPGLAAKIRVISWVGGGLEYGNATVYAEYNAYADPAAAEAVLNSGIPVTLGSLDMARSVQLGPLDLKKLARTSLPKPPQGQARAYGAEAKHRRGAHGFMAGPCAMAWLLNPSMFRGVRGRVAVIQCGPERGRTVLTPDSDGNILALTGTNSRAVKKLLLDSLP